MTSVPHSLLLKDNGFTTIDLTQSQVLSPVYELIDNFDSNFSLASDSREFHSQLHSLQSRVNQLKIHERIIDELSSVVVELLGSSFLGLTSTVYTRAVRPRPRSDILVENLPMHREIFYSDYSYANHMLNFHVPIKNYTPETCMMYYPRSHNVPDRKLQVVKLDSISSGVDRYSKGHSLGLPYNPKIIQNLHILGEPSRCSIAPGEIFLFDSRLIHGGGVNFSTKTRFSLDFAILPNRFLSSLKKHHHASYVSGSHFYGYTVKS